MADYYRGDGPAHILPQNIRPRVFQDHVEQTAALMNECFNSYHRAYHSLDNPSKVFGKKNQAAVDDLRSAVQADVRKAANVKSGFNVPGFDTVGMGWSLYETFVELAKNKGVWTDDDWQGNSVIKAPPGIFVFQDQMIVRGTEMANTQAQFTAWQKNMERWKFEKDWAKLGTFLSVGEGLVDKIGPKLWITIGATQKNTNQFVAQQNATLFNNQGVVKWIHYACQVNSLLNANVNINKSTDARAQLVAEAFAFVVQGLPVFGSAYAEVIRAVPKAMTFFLDYANRNARAINGQF